MGAAGCMTPKTHRWVTGYRVGIRGQRRSKTGLENEAVMLCHQATGFVLLLVLFCWVSCHSTLGRVQVSHPTPRQGFLPIRPVNQGLPSCTCSCLRVTMELTSLQAWLPLSSIFAHSVFMFYIHPPELNVGACQATASSFLLPALALANEPGTPAGPCSVLQVSAENCPP